MHTKTSRGCPELFSGVQDGAVLMRPAEVPGIADDELAFEIHFRRNGLSFEANGRISSSSVQLAMTRMLNAEGKFTTGRMALSAAM